MIRKHNFEMSYNANEAIGSLQSMSKTFHINDVAKNRMASADRSNASQLKSYLQSSHLSMGNTFTACQPSKAKMMSPGRITNSE